MDALQKEFTEDRPLVLVGCGNMGAALLAGWLENGLSPSAVHTVDPLTDPLVPHKLAGVYRDPGDFFAVCEDKGISPSALVLAVKPQYMADAVEPYRSKIPVDCLVISIAAGLKEAFYRSVFGVDQPLVRVMPNTPAAVGFGASLLCDLGGTNPLHRSMAESMLNTVGVYAWVDDESKIDSLTGVTGSGPAYVFLLIEALAAAGVDQGFTLDQAEEMAKQVVLGAATLASTSGQSPMTLRENVTSPGGVTKAALDILMKPKDGLVDLLIEACRAGTARAKELGET